MVTVRFREKCELMFFGKGVLKQKRFSMVDDLTVLNSNPLTRASKDPAVVFE